ncbi:nudC domain-containing 1 [Brachionus plicatilis]|uniref:NudC domain-containing protein 1 n=1 Tax=Brachionus plicatilis TaxID=10195 RepID=A0A3M7T580_BRAPC|nr:nudC domain-containing 1 [Brachionus plicatilis]
MSSASLMEIGEESSQIRPSPRQQDNAQWFDLHPNRELLNPSFEGYKLSLDGFVQYKLELHNKLDTYNFIESNESKQKFLLYQHLKLFGMPNLLVANQFDDSCLYFFDSELRLNRVVYNLPKLVPQRCVVPTNLKLNLENFERTAVTMKFVNETTAVVFDGFSSLYIVQIDVPTKSENPLVAENWNILLKWDLSQPETTCVLKDALFYNGLFHCLLLNVVETADSKSTPKFETLLNWLTFENKNSQWTLKRKRKINCFSSVPEYVSLETNGQSVFIVAPNYSKFVYDSEKPISESKSLASKPCTVQMETENFSEKFYSWSQTNEEVNVKIRLDLHKKDSVEKVFKSDVNVNLKHDFIQIIFRDNIILSGHLSSVIKLDESSWFLTNLETSDYLELNLVKGNAGQIWQFFMKDQDQCGEYKLDEEQNFANKMLAETLAKSSESKSLFTLEQQLEECDGMMDEQQMANVENEELFMMLRRMDGNTHDCTHKSFVNDTKFLFDVHLNANKPPALCLRHDVDGIVWQPHRVSHPAPSETIWLTHEHTFYAFGYVQASKQEAKFRSCPPDCSYVAVVDTKKHVYVYKQSLDKSDTELKHRKTGKLVTQVAKQFLISLDNDAEIYGIYCANDYLILMQRDFCYMFKISVDRN